MQNNNKDMSTTFEVINHSTFSVGALEGIHHSILSHNGQEIKVLVEGKSYNALVKSFDSNTKTCTINVNGYDFDIKIKEPIDTLIDELGFLKSQKASVKEIKSPMPGLVVNVFVEIGQTVTQGDKLLSLEAMKMENIIKSPSDGVVKNILVKQGSPVDKNQLLIAFE